MPYDRVPLLQTVCSALHLPHPVRGHAPCRRVRNLRSRGSWGGSRVYGRSWCGPTRRDRVELPDTDTGACGVCGVALNS